MPKQRYCIVRGNVFRWEEKAPFVPSGVSVLGAIEYDRDNKVIRCHECGAWMEWLPPHARKAHGVSTRQYKLRHGLSMATALASPELLLRLRARVRVSLPPAYHSSGDSRVRINAAASRAATARERIASAGSYHELRNERGTCKAQLTARITAIAAELGRAPRCDQVSGSILHAASVHFKSWPEACRSSGLTPIVGGAVKRFTRPVLIELLRDFYVLNGRTPRMRDFGNGSLPCDKVLRQEFGELSAALDCAGLGLVGAARVPK